MLARTTFGMVVLLCACSGENLEIGNDPVGTGGSGSTGSGGSSNASGGTGNEGNEDTPLPPELLEPLPAQNGCATDPEFERYLGAWEGNLEDQYFAAIEPVRLVINGWSAETGMCGIFTWGTLSAPAPADDPGAVYPSPDHWWPALTPFFALAIQGFPYSVTHTGVRLPELRIGLTPEEPWQTYCSIQTPVFDGAWGCIEGLHGSHSYTTAGGFDGTCDVQTAEGTARHSFFQCQACEPTTGVCACDASECVTERTQRTLAFTLVDDGTAMTSPYDGWGPTSWQPFNPHAFYLKHVEE